MSYDYDERAEELEDSPAVLRTSRPSYREIPRSLEEVGYCTPRPPYICRDRTGRWRQAHDFDLRDLRQRCLWCGKPRPAPA